MLKAVIADLTEVEDAVRPFYTKKDDRFVLNVTPVDGYELDDVVGLKTALGKERTFKAGLEARLKPFEGFDLDAAKQAMARVTEFGDLDPKVAREALATAERLSKFNPEQEAERLAEAKFNNSKTQIQGEFARREELLKTDLSSLQAQLAAATETLSKRDAQLKKTVKTNTIATELNKASPLDETRDMLELLADRQTEFRDVNGEQVLVVVDENGQPRVKLDAQYQNIPFTVADLMAELREKRASLFKPDPKAGFGTETTTGGGGTPNASDNPWMKGQINMTKQMVLIKTQPHLAARLKAEAGIP